MVARACRQRDSGNHTHQRAVPIMPRAYVPVLCRKRLISFGWTVLLPLFDPSWDWTGLDWDWDWTNRRHAGHQISKKIRMPVCGLMSQSRASQPRPILLQSAQSSDRRTLSFTTCRPSKSSPSPSKPFSANPTTGRVSKSQPGPSSEGCCCSRTQLDDPGTFLHWRRNFLVWSCAICASVSCPPYYCERSIILDLHYYYRILTLIRE